MKNTSRGFTLMELMLVLAIAAIILAIGAPSFSEFRRNNRMTGIANDFLGGIQTARSEAIKRQVPVSVCASDNPEADDATCSDGTFRGWIAFTDPDSNCARDTADPDEALVRVGARIDADGGGPFAVTPVSDGACASFAPNGFLQDALATGQAPASFTLFCDDRGNTAQGGGQSAARGLEITPTGRARINRDVAQIDTWPIECP